MFLDIRQFCGYPYKLGKIEYPQPLLRREVINGKLSDVKIKNMNDGKDSFTPRKEMPSGQDGINLWRSQTIFMD
ncbi:hypothetical protein LJB99_04635 [Deltaproteobacteria bacterium OttesenSCG-928-K17]|nr:hypothetical protein [Deltaproteobacteria bacterium OttesenSCG-928-K17]